MDKCPMCGGKLSQEQTEPAGPGGVRKVSVVCYSSTCKGRVLEVKTVDGAGRPLLLG